MYKGTSLWNPVTRFGRPMDISHGREPDHIFDKTTAVVDAVSSNSDYNDKTDFYIGGKIRNLSAKIMQEVDHLWT